MIWFDLKNLESKIAKDDLTDKDGFHYLLAYFILMSISSILPSDTDILISLLQGGIFVIITIWGITELYKVNNEFDGKDFLKRFLAITWVIGFRLFLISLPILIFIGVSIGMAISGSSPKYIMDLVIVVFTALFSIIYYLLAINSFRRLKVLSEQKSSI